MATTLKPYNTLTLSAATQVVAPGPGHYVAQLLGAVPFAVGSDSTVAVNGATSFDIPANILWTSPPFWGPTGLWINGAGAVSIALVPRGG